MTSCMVTSHDVCVRDGGSELRMGCAQAAALVHGWQAAGSQFLWGQRSDLPAAARFYWFFTACSQCFME